MHSETTNKRWKIHVLFSGLFLMAILVEMWFRFDTGFGVSEAFWNSVKAIKPMEASLFFAFWYMAVTGRWLAREDKHIICLNLKQ